MPKLGPIKRKELIHYMRRLGFEGPISGGNHQFMVRGSLKVWIPNPHEGGIGRNFLRKILKQAGISQSDWEKL
jgi:predicted RNA binding protein YcfA (HicA-like mRNA interferase family)